MCPGNLQILSLFHSTLVTGLHTGEGEGPHDVPRAPPAQVGHPGHRVGDCTAGQQHLDQTLSGGNLHLLLLSEADVQHPVDSGEEAVSADQQHQGKERPHLKFYRNVHNNYLNKNISRHYVSYI